MEVRSQEVIINVDRKLPPDGEKLVAGMCGLLADLCNNGMWSLGLQNFVVCIANTMEQTMTIYKKGGTGWNTSGNSKGWDTN